MDLTSPKESSPSIASPDLRTSPSKRPRKFTTVLKKLSTEWNSFLFKLRTLSENASQDEAVEELFQDSDSPDTFERFSRVGRGITANEEKFMKDYKKHRNLDKMFEANGPEPVKAEIEDMDTAKVPYRDLDIAKLRDDFDTHVKSVHLMSDTSTDSSRPSSVQGDPKLNIGEMLWEYRRRKWLTVDANEDIAAKISQRAAELSIKHIPRESYPRLYLNFVEKSKPLRANRRINLEDLVEVINAGWISEDKWERAAKGLA